jgi:hypothetical protein
MKTRIRLSLLSLSVCLLAARSDQRAPGRALREMTLCARHAARALEDKTISARNAARDRQHLIGQGQHIYCALFALSTQAAKLPGIFMQPKLCATARVRRSLQSQYPPDCAFSRSSDGDDSIFRFATELSSGPVAFLVQICGFRRANHAQLPTS